MNVEHERLKEILAKAAGKETPETRSAYLDAACHGDAALRQQLEALLAAHARAGNFLEQSVVPPEELPVSERPGTFIGRYQLLERIGEGGFGLVFMAEQAEPVQRKVALKIIKAGMDTREVIARFEAERQALALMNHPNIARVLDAGATETGRPFFVMELVNGIPITDYSDQKELSTTDRLRLFMKVCAAVQHAHQKGIIHRDLKPSNILVTLIDGEAVPKVIDFGVAKALGQKLTEKTLFTRFQQMIGTPAYMSPEQAELSGVDVDTRSDIYSLGVLLYELLTSRTPFDPKTLLAAGLDEMRRIIRETDPPRPSTRLSTLHDPERTAVAKHRQAEPGALSRLMQGDLDWIVMKALEKDRARRFGTASALADDLQHHLNHEPVQASPPSAAYRAQKFIRRHRFGVAMATTVALALAAGLAAALLGFERARTEASKSRQVAQFLKDMLQGVGPSVALGRNTEMLREILDKTAERVGQDLKGQPEVAAELLNTLGWVYYDLGDDSHAEAFHRDALALRTKLHGDEHQEVANSLHGLGRTLWRQGKLTEAETAHREALSIARKLFGNDHLDTARSLTELAGTLHEQGKSIEAETMDREALSTRRKLLREPHKDIASSLGLLAATLSAQGKTVEAEALYREGLAMRKQLFGNQHPDVALSLFRLSEVLAKQGKLAEAEALLHESVAMKRRLLPSNHSQLLWPLCSLANALAGQGKVAESEPFYREAMEALRREAQQGQAWAQNGLAWVLATAVHAGVRDGAEAVSFAEQAVAATNRKDPDCLNTLAAAHAEKGQFSKAVSAQSEAIALLPDGLRKADYESRRKLYESGSPHRDRVFETRPDR